MPDLVTERATEIHIRGGVDAEPRGNDSKNAQRVIRFRVAPSVRGMRK